MRHSLTATFLIFVSAVHMHYIECPLITPAGYLSSAAVVSHPHASKAVVRRQRNRAGAEAFGGGSEGQRGLSCTNYCAGDEACGGHAPHHPAAGVRLDSSCVSRVRDSAGTEETLLCEDDAADGTGPRCEGTLPLVPLH